MELIKETNQQTSTCMYRGLCIKYPKWSYLIDRAKFGRCSNCERAIPIGELLPNNCCPCCGVKVALNRSKIAKQLDIAFSNNIAGYNEGLVAVMMAKHPNGVTLKFLTIQLDIGKRKVWDSLQGLVRKNFAYKEGKDHLKRIYKLSNAGYTFATGIDIVFNAIREAKAFPAVKTEEVLQ